MTTIAPPGLPVALDATLERVAGVLPRAASALRGDLTTALRGVRQDPWQAVAWQFSTLTGDGFPVELAFTGEGREVRATVEVAGASEPERDRLARALDVAAELGGHPAPAAASLLDAVGREQHGAQLSWGAWLSVRRSEAGSSAPVLKVYAELPRSRPGSAPRAGLLGSGPLGSGPLGSVVRRWTAGAALDARCSLVGVHLGTGAAELYVRDAVPVDRLARLCARCGVAGREGELVQAVERIAARPADLVLSSRQTGWSVAVAPDGAPLALALHVAARAVVGGDARVRPGLLAHAGAQGWQLGAYAAATRPLATTTATARTAGPPDRLRTVHGVLSLALTPGRSVGVQIGVRPLDAAATPTGRPTDPTRT